MYLKDKLLTAVYGEGWGVESNKIGEFLLFTLSPSVLLIFSFFKKQEYFIF